MKQQARKIKFPGEGNKKVMNKGKRLQIWTLRKCNNSQVATHNETPQ